MTTQLPGGGLDPSGATGSPGSPNPLDQSDAWDVVVLAGQASPGPPGYAVVTGAGTPRKLDERDGHGQSGATIAYTGDKISKFTVTIYLVETSDWNAWWQWRQLLAKPPAGTIPQALSIYHPVLAELGIDAVIIEEEGQPEPDGDTGLWKVPIKMAQYRKPTPALAVPQGASFADPKFDTPMSAAEKQIAKLTNQVTELAK